MGLKIDQIGFRDVSGLLVTSAPVVHGCWDLGRRNPWRLFCLIDSCSDSTFVGGGGISQTRLPLKIRGWGVYRIR